MPTRGGYEMASQLITFHQPIQGFPATPQKPLAQPQTYTHAELEALSDNQLIDLTLEGVSQAFELLVKRHQRQMYALALKMVRNHEDASDIAQDVFLKAYEVLGSFQKKSSFHTWLYRITVNYCINHLRRDKAQFHVELETFHAIKTAEAFENLDILELQEELNKAIRRLPEKQQKTVFLRACEGLPYKEIANILGCSVGTVKANYFHAVKNLKRFMKTTILAHAS
jgi:RNA polymerase sigma-70 factor (ECF subfamily)